MILDDEDRATVERLNAEYEEELKKVLMAEVGLKMARSRVESFTIAFIVKHKNNAEAKSDLLGLFKNAINSPKKATYES